MSVNTLPKIREELLAGNKRIIVVQTAFIGDVVLLTPLLRALRMEFPLTKVTCLVIPQCRELVESWCDDVIVVDKKTATKKDWQQLLIEISQREFDLAIIPHRSYRSGRLMKEAGIPVRIGFDKGGGRQYHSHRVFYDPWSYEGRRNISLLAPLGCTGQNPSPELIIPPNDSSRVDSLMDQIGLRRGKFVLAAPASVWKTKAWPAKHYRRLSELLKAKFDLTMVAVGGSEDGHVCSNALTEPFYNLAGKLSLVESAALMQRSKFVVSGDSAATHLATASGSKNVIVLGSTAPRFGFALETDNTRVLGVDLFCRPCTDHGRQKCPVSYIPKCLWNITAETVIEATSDWLH